MFLVVSFPVPPVVWCPQSTSATTSAGNSSAVVTLMPATPIGQDYHGNVLTNISCSVNGTSIVLTDPYEYGVTTIDCVAVDDMNQVGMCQFTVTIMGESAAWQGSIDYAFKEYFEILSRFIHVQ